VEPIALIHQSEPRLARVYRARLARNFDEAERLLRKKLDRQPHEASARALARLLVELHRPEEAQPLWSDLARLNSNDFEASYHLAAWQVANGMTLHEAVAKAAPTTTETFRSRLRRVMTQPVAEQNPDMSLRHIAISGASFCGSTILDRIIGSLPGVASIGESHWLTQMRDGTEIDFSIESPPLIPCSVCHLSCQVLTFDFRMDLAANRTNWYQKIGQRLGTKVLTSADKNWSKLLWNDPLLRMDALVLFKSPAQAWSSQRTKLPPGDGSAYEERLEKYIRTWCDHYSAFVGSFNPCGTVTFLCFDNFAASRGKLLGPLCAALDLAYEESALTQVRRGHAIGGNKNALGRLRTSDYAFNVLPLPDVDLPPREAAMLDENTEMQELYAILRWKQDQVLAAAAAPVAARC
jgi:hypothetical protein